MKNLAQNLLCNEHAGSAWVDDLSIDLYRGRFEHLELCFVVSHGFLGWSFRRYFGENIIFNTRANKKSR